MKQIALIGDLARWKQETEFITEMLHFTATKVITINIGSKPVVADLNRRELQQLFPSPCLEECIGTAMTKLFSQGVTDGVLALVDNDSKSFPVLESALNAFPFGMPRVAIISGDSSWRGQRDVIQVYLPGTSYNLNPVIKITLCNTVFAISGISLCNIHNFGSNRPMIGVSLNGLELGEDLDAQGLNYIHFDSHDTQLKTLLGNGYINGLLLSQEIDNFSVWLEAALSRQVPLAVTGEDPDSFLAIMERISTPIHSAIIYVTADDLTSGLLSFFPPAKKIQFKETNEWLQMYKVNYRYGTAQYYKAAIKIMGTFVQKI